MIENSLVKEENDKELTQAKLKIIALESMIDIAEEQFKINIRKKFPNSRKNKAGKS